MSSLGDLESVEKVSPTPRKRKLRKGTQSCWECKRRKTRCFYAAPAESTCLGCRSRNIKCISQEFEEDLLAAGPEAMTEPARKRTNASAARPVQRRGERTLKIAPVSWEALPLYGPSSETASVMLEPYQETYFALAEVWPATCDLSLAYSAAFKNSYMLRGPFFSPYSKSCYQNELSPQEVLQLPPTGSHPVLFARKLLLLSDLFQQVPSETCEDAAHLHGMAMQILDRVAALVTTNDELISSVEGIECVALEIDGTASTRAAVIAQVR
ncbi:hypothetical protein BU23DRAFT_597767 [Bimuria novae-zelandiae CBS 107.79]|uniref:Zn(2)-C6 fungal-type domain-containing protein n=1 Tax=Bimuria novae-zelandiae CBS 107.79 TaxID=1447943 RepID=A0A6A5VDD4_9PLEO|nr:hypothetical protein BU23DRAFT_597767 [Bimuria novae-zelandiae CBS 107.79]